MAFVLLFPLPLRAEQGLMRIDYPEFWPFFARQDNGEMTGFFYEIVTTALTEMGIAARWEAYPWSRCQTNVKNGEADAMITVPTSERLEYTQTHADPFYLKELKVFTYSGHPRLEAIEKIRTIDDIIAGEFSVVTYIGNGWSEKNLATRGVKIEASAQLINVWRMLAHKRGDIVIEWPIAAWPDIRKAGLEGQIVQTGVSLESMPFHLLVRKGSPHAARLDEFNRIILRMQADGSQQDIVNSYVSSPEN
jgi:polar amino acid transport system substrate-binding protein